MSQTFHSGKVSRVLQLPLFLSGQFTTKFLIMRATVCHDIGNYHLKDGKLVLTKAWRLMGGGLAASSVGACEVGCFVLFLCCSL